MIKREVKIVLQNKNWFVKYVKRQKFQRYSAAQFDARFYGKEVVIKWIESNSKLKLIEDEKEKSNES